jgi:acylphosphatase
MTTVCKHVRYSGHVQGVGFRYTAQSLAARYLVAGFVRNLPDGDVELVAEGEPGPVDEFLAAVARRMGEYITAATAQDRAPAGVAGFHVRH